MHAREDASDFDGMVNVRLAADALLPVMGFGAEQIGAINVGDVFRFEISFEKRAQIADLKPLIQR